MVIWASSTPVGTETSVLYWLLVVCIVYKKHRGRGQSHLRDEIIYGLNVRFEGVSNPDVLVHTSVNSVKLLQNYFKEVFCSKILVKVSTT